MQVLNDKKFANTRNVHLLQTLFLALCAMLTECLFILFFLSSNLPIIYYIPIITQLLFFGAIVIYLSMRADSHPATGTALPTIQRWRC
jgi:hypothetical protein